MRLRTWIALLCVGLPGLSPEIGHAAKPVAASKLITPKTPGHRAELTAKLGDATELYLVVTEGGNSHACDWANWVEPTLSGPAGKLALTELKPIVSQVGWGSVHVNKNAAGKAMSVAGQPVSFGFGVHAHSVLGFKLPQGYDLLTVTGALDDGGVSQGGCGQNAAVTFEIYTEKPKMQLASKGAAKPSISRDADDALAGLETHPDLTATLFAAEPMLLSPTNIDVDHLGRVWVCEVVNYRQFRNKDTPEREEGDRILILEDTDGDGTADTTHVFYQGRDIDSAHGVCVLGNRAIVSAGDSVFVLIDDDGDLKADRKEVLFTGIAGTQHDHGIHSFLFGPDGRLYFNFGNAGKHLRDRNGKPIVDRAGNTIDDSRKPYQEGMIFRCEMDGSNVETLAWNFRNNWEVAVDSFGNLWQSDNDDDGNRGVRINFVMEYGNYGYKDELTGAGWRSERIGMHEEIPKRHWHLNDPGVVPNLLQTGAGSPTGILVYEGDLLPASLRGEVIHCDAGPNIVRAYPTEVDGAGYTAEIVNLLEGTRDKWFRPSDVCTAPDGSLIVADWYDPGVGGHRMADIQKGRLFRLTPTGKAERYTAPKYDFNTAQGAVKALMSPNLAARYLAWTALHEMGAKAEPELQALATAGQPHHRARALWLLARIPGRTAKTIQQAISSDNPQLRIVGLRIARQMKTDLVPTIEALVTDDSAQVRRECAVALVEVDTPVAVPLWTRLAEQFGGDDRWMLEALGAAARGRWDACMLHYIQTRQQKTWLADPGTQQIVWRSRAKVTPQLLTSMLLNPKMEAERLPQLLRALDFQPNDQGRTTALLKIAFKNPHLPEERRSLLQREALARIPANVLNQPATRQQLREVVADMRGTASFVDLVTRFDLKDEYPGVLAIAQEHPREQLGVEAISALLKKGQGKLIVDALDDRETAEKTLTALETSQNGAVVPLLWPIMTDSKTDAAVRRKAVRAVAATKNGQERLAKWAGGSQFDTGLKDTVAAALHASSIAEIRKEADRLFPRPAGKDNKPIPTLAELMAKKGDVPNGRLVFHTTGTCNKCHVVGKLGREVGPNLSLIGKKLSRRAMFESILYPSAGISHNYEMYTIVTIDGNVVSGIMVSETPEKVSVKGNDAIVRTFVRDDIDEMAKQKISMMPADLQKLMTTQELVDVVEYMLTLKEEQTAEE